MNTQDINKQTTNQRDYLLGVQETAESSAQGRVAGGMTVGGRDAGSGMTAGGMAGGGEVEGGGRKTFAWDERPLTKKTVATSALIGFPIGVMIGDIIVIIVSLIYADGGFHPVTPAMAAWMPSELAAICLQSALCGLIGAVYGAANLIFRVDSWSLARQTLTHFLLLATAMVGTATICGWSSPREPSLQATLVYMLIFVVIYLVIWIALYAYWKSWIKKVNMRLGSSRA